MKRKRVLRLDTRDAEGLRAELDEELTFHVEARADELVRVGMSRESALARAQSELAHVAHYRERIIGEDRLRVEQRERSRFLEELRHDFRYAWRQLLGERWFAVLVIATLAIGIGANVTVFTLVDRLFLRQLAYPAPERLVSVNLEDGFMYSPLVRERVAARTGRAFQLAGWSGWGFTLTGAGPAESLDGAAVTTNLFEVLGTAPMLGRGFRETDRIPGQRPAVLSHGVWQRRFGGDPGILGRVITLNGESVPVVGVMPPDFAFPDRDAEVWLPIVYQNGEAPNTFSTEWVARLQSGVSSEAAHSALVQAAAGIRADHPEVGAKFGERPTVKPLREGLIGEFRKPAWILFGAVTFVLLIACVNVANLLLTRAHGRAREMAIRAALVARRARLIRQLVTESSLMAGAAVALGLTLAHFALRGLLLWLPVEVTAFTALSIDLRVLLYAAGAAAFTVVLCGLAPALSIPLDRTCERLKAASRSVSAGGASKRTLKLLIATETALSVLLAIGAALMLQSFWRLRAESTGFVQENVLTMKVTGSRRDPDDKRAFHRELRRQISALPDVAAYGTVQLLPLSGSNWNPTLTIQGRPPGGPGEELVVDWRSVGDGFFRTMGVPLMRGRSFDARDHATGAPVALVSETLARRYFPGSDAIGQRVTTGFEGDGNWVTVVGITADLKDQSLTGAAHPILFRPHEQVPINPMVLLVCTHGKSGDIATTIENIVRTTDPDAAIKDVQPLARVIGNSVAQPRLLTLLLTCFGALALLLGTIGLFGVISYIVERRTPEFSIRVALGAQRGDLLRLVIQDGMGTVLVGVLAGALGAFTLTGMLSSQLYEVQALDPLTFMLVPAGVLLIALMATLLPARRAARISGSFTGD